MSEDRMTFDFKVMSKGANFTKRNPLTTHSVEAQ